MSLKFTDLHGPHALVDGDLIVYASAHANDGSAWYWIDDEGNAFEFRYKKDAIAYLKDNGLEDYVDDLVQAFHPLPVHYVYADIDRQMNYILESCNTDRFTVYLTGKNNFRKELTDTYKAHRKEQRKPEHFQAAFDYMINMWDAVVVDGMEADDMLGIEQQYDGSTIICTKDKDLDMIPGWHFNFGRDEMYNVTRDEGRKFFFTQLITGDRADNIWGIPGMGPKKAEKFLDSLDPNEWSEAIKDLYEQHAPPEVEDAYELFTTNWQLLRILEEMPDGKEVERLSG
jgi:hypothetical protein